MSAQTYTHRELAKFLGVSETTVKSYRSKFPTFLPVARQGKPVRLHPEALKVCLRIRDLFAEGLTVLQTTQLLRAEFKEYPLNRRLSTASKQATGTRPSNCAPGPAENESLGGQIRTLSLHQQITQERMEQLEAEVRNLATLEAASKALVAELLAELRSARADNRGVQYPQGPAPQPSPSRTPKPEPAAQAGQPPEPAAAPATEPGADRSPSVVTARKIVTVHGRSGPVASYALGREPSPQPLFPEPQAPAPSFLELPAVIRSDRGDFLGLPGGQSVRRLVEVLSPEGAAPVSWFPEQDQAWTCAIPLGRAQTREILFERTTTPRGNLVGLIRRMRINEVEATPEQLQEIFRQLRDQMS